MTLLQPTFDDLGTPLIDTTFCVVDLETTGGSSTDDAICEIGAVKVRGGECLGTFHTLVDPGRPIPPGITVLTGLTSAMVLPAPPIQTVLPSLLEFLGDATLVAHNARFDVGFLDAALTRTDRARLSNPVVDTVGLARRLLAGEVPNHKLSTLADRLRLDHRPSHRALDDALATTDLLHVLLERAAAYGVLGLDDLLSLPTAASHPQASKLQLTADLPRAPGVYLFRDPQRRVLYVGKATNLRSRVRSYFSSDTRRKVSGLLRETGFVDHITCDSPLDAAVLEVRLIHEHLPRYNRQHTTFAKAAYLKLTGERFPRLSVVRRVHDDGGTYLGPLPSARVATLVGDAVQSCVPIRRCTADPARSPRPAPCAPAQIGVATCPCAGAIGEHEYATIADDAIGALAHRPEVVIEPLTARMGRLATEERYEEAADVRDRLAAFVDAHRRVRRLGGLRAAGTVVLGFRRRRYVFEDGRLVHSEPADAPSLLTTGPRATEPEATAAPVLDRPSDADELSVVASWVDTHAGELALVHTDRPLYSPLPALPRVATRR